MILENNLHKKKFFLELKQIIIYVIEFEIIEVGAT